jgi:hypothetical protein
VLDELERRFGTGGFEEKASRVRRLLGLLPNLGRDRRVTPLEQGAHVAVFRELSVTRLEHAREPFEDVRATHGRQSSGGEQQRRLD